jgi:hypothetical protein
MMKQFVLQRGLDLDYMIVAKDAIEFEKWKGRNIEIVDELSVDEDTTMVIPVGTVQFVNYVRAQLGHDELFVENWPSDIHKFMVQSETQFGEGKLGELPFFPIFVKPKYDNKLFMGELLKSQDEVNHLKNMVMFDSPNKHIDDDTEVYWSVPVQFLAEWRSIIFQGEIISFSPYDSDKNHHKELFTEQGGAYEYTLGIAKEIDSTKARVVDIGMTSIGQYGIVECANHITTASTYTTMIDRQKYFKALCSIGIRPT